MLFDAEVFAQSVELVLAIEFALARGEPANGELFSAVGQQLGDFDRAGVVQRLSETACTGGSLVGLDGDKDPASSPVDDHKELAPERLVGRLR